MKLNSRKIKTYSFIWQLIKYKPRLYLFQSIINIMIHGIPLISGIIIKIFFDILEGKTSLDFGIWDLAMLILLVAFIHVLTIQIGYRLSTLYGFTVTTLLRSNILSAILNRNGGNRSNISTGETINTLRDDVDGIESCINWLAWLTGQIAFAIFAIVILFKVNAKIALFVFIPLVFGIILLKNLQGKVEENREESRQTTADVSGAVGEMFESILAVKVSGAEKDIVNNLKKLNEKRHHSMVKDSLVTQLIESIYDNAVVLGTGVILLLVSQSMKTGTFSIGDFALTIFYLNFVTDGIESLTNWFLRYRQTGISFKRLMKLIKSEDENDLVKHKPIYLKEEDVKESNNNERRKNIGNEEIHSDFQEKKLNKIEVKGLSYHYDNSKNGISDINFILTKEKVVVICGRTGSGKTTLLKTLLGLLPAQSGEIYWNDGIINNPKTFFVPPISSYTSQVPKLFSDTVRDNILLGISEEESDLENAINSAVLEKDIETLEKGLDTVIGARGVKLSGGQVQRVAAARMFIRNAQLLVLDDISSALDIETEKTLWKRLFKEKNPTCIVVSNRRFALQQADNIILMKDGVIEAQGRLDDLLKSSIEMQQIYGI